MPPRLDHRTNFAPGVKYHFWPIFDNPGYCLILPTNKLFMIAIHEASLDRVMAILGYNFQTPSLLSEALHVAGSLWTTPDGRLQREGNKPLAGIGGRIIDLYITEEAYNQSLSTGMTSRQLQQRSNNGFLATVFTNFNLEDELVKNPSQPDFVSVTTQATTVEAIVGAAYRDGGIDAAVTVIKTLGI